MDKTYVAQVRGADGQWHPIRTLRGATGPQGPIGPRGFPGRGLYINGVVQSAEQLPAAPSQSEAWLVGEQAPYDVYLYSNGWVNLGPIQGAAGAKYIPDVSEDGVLSWTNDGGLDNPEPVNIMGPRGPKGEIGPQGAQGPTGPAGPQGNAGLTGLPGPKGNNGYTYEPIISEGGVLSWTNDGGLDNPEPVNIMGPQGPQGTPGADGKSPYEIAKEAGYSGTETTFNNALTQFPAHRQRHEEGGADAITVTSGMIEAGAVTADKLADSAKSKGVAVVLTAAGWTDNTQTVSVSGVTAGNNVLVAAAPASRTVWNDAEVYCSAQAAGTLTFTCGSTPASDITANVVILV